MEDTSEDTPLLQNTSTRRPITRSHSQNELSSHSLLQSSPPDHDLLATPHLIRALAAQAHTPSQTGPDLKRDITFYDRVRYYVPIFQWLPSYSVEHFFLGDILAGVTTGVMLIPQAIAYATLANLPPIHGLYTAFFPLLVYFIMGSSRQLAVGPEATTAMLIGQMLLRVAPVVLDLDLTTATPEQTSAAFLGLAASCCLLSAIITLALGLLRVGFVQSILSTPILSGFVCAVAFLLIVDQSAKLMGIVPKGMSLDASSFEKMIYLSDHLNEIHLPTLCVSMVTVTSLLGLRFLKSRYPHHRLMAVLPEVLIVVVAMTIASKVLNLPSYGVVTLGVMDYGFQPPALPDLTPSTLSRLLPSALTISILGFCTSQLITKLQCAKYGYRVSPNRELVALGLANVVGAIFGSLPAYGSITRTKVFDNAGGRTPFGLLLAATTTCFAIMWALPLFAAMPKAVVASVIMVVAFSIIDINEILFLIHIGARRDLYMLLAMTIFTFLFGLESGIVFAFGSCLLIVVKQTNRPALTLLGRNRGDNEFYDVSAVEFEAESLEGLLIIRVEGPLYFANIHTFVSICERYEQFQDIHAAPFAQPNPVHVAHAIIDLTNMPSVDSTGIHVFESLIHNYLSRGIRVCLVRPRRHIQALLDASGITRAVGSVNIYRRLQDAVLACEKQRTSGVGIDIPSSSVPMDSHLKNVNGE